MSSLAPLNVMEENVRPRGSYVAWHVVPEPKEVCVQSFKKNVQTCLFRCGNPRECGRVRPACGRTSTAGRRGWTAGSGGGETLTAVRGRTSPAASTVTTGPTTGKNTSSLWRLSGLKKKIVWFRFPTDPVNLCATQIIL